MGISGSRNYIQKMKTLSTDVGIQEMNHFYMEMPPAKSSVHCDTQGLLLILSFETKR